jgi:hypothetical protein
MVYLAVAFGLAWLAQIAVVNALPGGVASLGGGLLVVTALVMWPPALGAIVVRKWVERSGFADAGPALARLALWPSGMVWPGHLPRSRR